jgi:hypothetical protein
MPDLTDADTKTFIGDMISALDANRAILTAGNPAVPGSGWDPATRITALQNGEETVKNDEKIISAAEVTLDQAVKTRRADLDANYRLASATLGSVEGALGKDHPLVKQLRQLRSSYSHAPAEKDEPPAK